MAGNMLVMAAASKAVAFVAEKISESANASEIAAEKATGLVKAMASPCSLNRAVRSGMRSEILPMICL